MAEKRGQQARGVRAEMFAGSRWETCRTVDAAVKAREPMAMVHKGYPNMAVERRRDAHELWTGVLAECLPDLEQVAEAVPEGLATDLQFSRLK